MINWYNLMPLSVSERYGVAANYLIVECFYADYAWKRGLSQATALEGLNEYLDERGYEPMSLDVMSRTVVFVLRNLQAYYQRGDMQVAVRAEKHVNGSNGQILHVIHAYPTVLDVCRVLQEKGLASSDQILELALGELERVRSKRKGGLVERR